MDSLAVQIRAAMPEVWRRLSSPQKVVVAGAASVCIASLLAFTFWSRQPDFTPVFTGLSQMDAAAVVEKLKEQKVPYQLASGGSAVLVPSAQVHEVRLQLAADGLPKGNGVGFELFDKTSFGATEFTQRLNYQRALEGELGRTIAQLAAVEAARVHLVLPEKRLFADQQSEASASVVLKLRPGAQIDKRQVGGIRHLVAAAVEGLKVEHVSVLDVDGQLLANDSEETSLGATPDRLEVQRGFEHDLERSLQTMLERALGPNRAAVKVSAVLNWDQWEANSESFSPPDKPAQVRSAQTVEETSRGQTAAAAGGVAGVDANIPTYQSQETQQQNGAEYARRESVTNYELSKVVERRVKAPGALERLSVAVMLDQSIDPQQASAIRDLVMAASGATPARGDTVTIASLPFDHSRMAAERAAIEQARQQELLMDGAKIAAVLLGLLVLLVIVSRITRRVASRTIVTDMGEAWRAGRLAGMATPGVAAPAAAMALPLGEEQERRHQARQRVATLARTKPGVVAEIIEGWMAEERRD